MLFIFGKLNTEASIENFCASIESSIEDFSVRVGLLCKRNTALLCLLSTYSDVQLNPTVKKSFFNFFWRATKIFGVSVSLLSKPNILDTFLYSCAS